jgi:hypothetical protein
VLGLLYLLIDCVRPLCGIGPVWILGLSRQLSEDMLAVDDVVLSAYLEVVLPNDLNACIILDELVVAPVNIVVKGRLVQISLY